MSCDECLGVNRLKIHPRENGEVVTLCCKCINDPEVRERWGVID